jgi:hypothetical protein
MEIPVLLVLDGGIGRTIDRFALCSSLFLQHNIPILGVVVNRVMESKLEKVKEYLDPWFGSRGIPVFGYVPYVNSLARPSIGMLGRELGFQVEHGGQRESPSPAVGFMTAFGSTAEILQEIGENPESALLLGSGRGDVLEAILARRLSGNLDRGPGAIVLCGDSTAGDHWAAEGCRRLGIPLYMTARSANDSVSILNRRVFKVEPGESVKIDEIVRTIKGSVDLEAMIDALSAPARVTVPSERPASRLRSWLSRIFRRR